MPETESEPAPAKAVEQPAEKVPKNVEKHFKKIAQLRSDFTETEQSEQTEMESNDDSNSTEFGDFRRSNGKDIVPTLCSHRV